MNDQPERGRVAGALWLIVIALSAVAICVAGVLRHLDEGQTPPAGKVTVRVCGEEQ